jgi:hypothetical protein
MELTEFLSHTNGYIEQLRGVLGRFVQTRDSISIADSDEPLLHRLVIELRDLFQDALGASDYSQMVVDSYNKGKANYFDSPSYASVEEIISIVAAANTRVGNNPMLLLPPASHSSQPLAESLSLPDKVTLKWLFAHVPYSFWAYAGGLLVGAFALGAAAVYKLQIIQQWFGLNCTG